MTSFVFEVTADILIVPRGNDYPSEATPTVHMAKKPARNVDAAGRLINF